MQKKITIPQLIEKKQKKEKITMLTCYDYSFAKILEDAGIDIILVGDSLGMVVQGHDSTVYVELEDIIYHCRCVKRAIKTAFIVGDMPFLTYEASPFDAVKNAGRIIKEGGADAVKLEGGIRVIDRVKAILDAGIPVMGHIGLTPQTATMLGGFRVQGKDVDSARKIIEDAKALSEAGVFALVLECVPYNLAKLITELVSVPTIGIGAGSFCDGQVLVLYDMLGLFEGFKLKFVKQYLNLYSQIKDAVSLYINEVKQSVFPSIDEHSFSMNEEVYHKLKEEYGL